MVAAFLAMRWSLSDIWNNARFLETAAAVSTLVLIVGAIHEDWTKLKKIGFLTAKCILFRSNSFERCVLRKLLLHSIGAILVVLGIAGELIFETRTFIIEDRETAVLTEEAGDAATSARNAVADAKTAHDLAQSVSTVAKEAKAKAASADTLASNAFARAKLADLKVNETGKSVVVVKEEIGDVSAYAARVEEKYAPRTLSKDERDALIAVLTNAPIHPSSPVELDSFIGAPDGVSFGTELVNAINDPKTGWSARFRAQNAMGGNLKGVVLIIHDLQSAPAWAIYLQHALKAAGLKGDAFISEQQAAGTVMIFVAPKN